MKNFGVFIPALLAVVLVLKLACLPAPDRIYDQYLESSTVLTDTVETILEFPYDTIFHKKKVVYFVNEIPVDESSSMGKIGFQRPQAFTVETVYLDHVYWISDDGLMRVEVEKSTNTVTSVTRFLNPFDTSFRVYF